MTEVSFKVILSPLISFSRGLKIPPMNEEKPRILIAEDEEAVITFYSAAAWRRPARGGRWP